MVRGAVVYAYVIILACALTAVAHNYLHSSFNPAVTFGCLFLAGFFGLVDQYVLIRATGFMAGMVGLLRGGLRTDVRIGADFPSRLCRWVRIGMMFLLAGDLALFAGLSANEAAIEKRITKAEFALNSVALQKATKNVDAKRDAVVKEYEAALAAQQVLTPEVSRLIQQANRSSSSKAADKLSANEARLEKAVERVNALRKQIDALDAARAAEIERVKQSPGYIPRDDSFIARLQALADEISDHPLVLLPMAALGLVILGSDLVVLTLKGIGMPSVYWMLDTRRHLSEMVKQSRLAEAQTAQAEPAANSEPKNDRPYLGPPLTSLPNNAPEPRRGRGRPPGSPNKKHLNGGVGDSSHD
jgi:hypothetical protein